MPGRDVLPRHICQRKIGSEPMAAMMAQPVWLFSVGTKQALVTHLVAKIKAV